MSQFLLPFLFLELTATAGDESASLLGEYVAPLPPGIGRVSKKLPLGGLLGLVRLEIVGATPIAGFLGVDGAGIEGGLEWCPAGKPPEAEAALDGDSLCECLCLYLCLCLCVPSVLWPLSTEPEESAMCSLVLLTELELEEAEVIAAALVVVSIINALEKSS